VADPRSALCQHALRQVRTDDRDYLPFKAGKPRGGGFKILRDPAGTMENTNQLFLGFRFNCNKCHDHPFERWTQDQYYQTAANFTQVGLTDDPASNGRMVGGTDVEVPKPLYEVVADTGKGCVIHDRTKKIFAPKFPFPAEHAKPSPGGVRRLEQSSWLNSKDNPYFAKSCVNRFWAYLMGPASSGRSTTLAPSTQPLARNCSTT
jgi:Protein of unknown function (DUF1549)